MTSEELLEIVSCGETSKVQFKGRISHPDSVAAELIAFSNTKGGVILFGINDKTGGLNGLSFDEIRDMLYPMEDFRELTQRDVSKIARLLNGHPRERPRKTLDFKTPYEVFSELR